MMQLNMVPIQRKQLRAISPKPWYYIQFSQHLTFAVTPPPFKGVGIISGIEDQLRPKPIYFSASLLWLYVNMSTPNFLHLFCVLCFCFYFVLLFCSDSVDRQETCNQRRRIDINTDHGPGFEPGSLVLCLLSTKWSVELKNHSKMELLWHYCSVNLPSANVGFRRVSSKNEPNAPLFIAFM